MKVKIYPEEFDPEIASRDAIDTDDRPWTHEQHLRMKAMEEATPVQEVANDFVRPVGVWVEVIEENRSSLFGRKI